jgi:type I restriction enzyme, S subunit
MTVEAPDQWSSARLSELGSFANGINKGKEDFGFGVPFINLQDVFGKQAVTAVPQGLVNADQSEVTRYRVREGDVLFVRSSVKPEGVGKTAVVLRELGETIYSGFIIRFRPSDGLFEKQYLKYAFHETGFRKRLLAKSTINANANINQKALGTLFLPMPPLPEQKKIAAILGSVDDAIAATKAVIDQTKQVKKGLLQTLFHRASWDKRPIPESYSINLLDDVAKRGSGHTPNRKIPEYWNGGIKWVSLQDTRKLDRLYISETTAEISLLGIENSSAVLHPKNIVVLSRDATVGKSAITTEEMAVSQHFMAWQCGSKIDRYYLYYWLQYMKPVFERIGAGSTIKTIGLLFFKKLKIALPLVDRQRFIGRRLKEIDEAIFIGEEEFVQLQNLKSSLMSDLLTGRKRVAA